MPVGIDMNWVKPLDSGDQMENDIDFPYGTAGRHQSFSTIELDWGRPSGTPVFNVDISVNGTFVATRSPKEVDSSGGTWLDRVYVRGIIRDTDDSSPNVLRLRALTADNFVLRSISTIFHQDF